MKPAWDSLATQFQGSDKVLIADVDCTAGGEPLCSRFGVEGFPTIKYFNPPDEEGEDYEGGRDEASLVEFAKTKLGPGCSASQLQYCSAEEKAELEEVSAMTEEARSAELEAITAEMKAKEEAHDELLKSLQAQYDASNEEVEELKKKLKPRIKLLKKAGAKAAPAAAKEEL
jgi:protein disulfide-isomerase A6